MDTEQKLIAANKMQIGGEHYRKRGDLQHWDVVIHFELDYFQGQITKYVMRWKDKNGIEDLRKARHFLDKYIENAEKTAVGYVMVTTADPSSRGYVNQE